MLEKEKKIKVFKSQIKFYITVGIIQTVTIGVFLIFYHKPLAVLLFLIGVLLVLWVGAILKIFSALSGIKELKEK